MVTAAETHIRVLLIDDDPVFYNHFKLYAAISNWKEEHLDETEIEKLTHRLGSLNPNIILLDLFENVDNWLDILSKKGFIDCTYISSGNLSINKESFTESGYNIAGILFKPISLANLPNLIKTTTNQTKEIKTKGISFNEFSDLAKKLDPAISIHRLLDENHVEQIWENESCDKNPLNKSDNDLLRLMAHELEKEGKNFITREEWNPDKEQWVHFRLYYLKKHHYWFSREYRDDLPQLYKNQYSQRVNLSKFLEQVANALKQWGITRLRFYNVYEIYDDASSQPDKKDYIIIPLFSQGGGFNPSKNDWEKQYFSSKESSDMKNSFISKQWFYKNAKIDKTYNKNSCVNYIGWGEEEITGVDIPIFHKKDYNKAAEHIGLLSFDRRYDHITREKLVEEYSWWKVIFKEGGNINPANITNTELERMKGFFDIAKEEIVEYLRKSKANQLKLWHEIFTQSTRYLMQEKTNNAKVNSEKIVGLFLNHLINWWEYIDSEPMDEDIPPEPPSDKPNQSIVNWYFLKQDLGDSLLGIGGYGELAKHYTKTHSLLVKPFRDAMQNQNTYKDNYLIQDFEEWLKKREKNGSRPKDIEYFQEQSRLTPNYEKLIEEIKSWAGFPIQAGSNSYLMVVHANKKNYFTTRRAKLLRTVALRLAPFLLWGDSENSRTYLLKMLNHELNTPLAITKQAVNLMPEGSSKLLALHNMGLLEAIIKNMSYLYNDNPIKNPDDTTCLGDIWDVVQIASSLDQSKTSDIRTHTYDQVKLAVPKEVLRQVLFNLLANAFKFSYGHTTPAVIVEAIRENNHLACRISNYTNRKMTDKERQWIFTLGYKVPNSGTASGYGLGLAIVKMLCDRTRIKYMAEEPKATEKVNIWLQTFTLLIPLAGDE